MIDTTDALGFFGDRAEFQRVLDDQIVQLQIVQVHIEPPCTLITAIAARYQRTMALMSSNVPEDPLHWCVISMGKLQEGAASSPQRYENFQAHAWEHELLMNLMRNAFQHGDPAAPITLSATRDSQALTLAVHNLGTPIPQSLLPHVFEPLRRGDARPAEHDSFSLGLGLYIAHTIALAHEGSLTVESTQEQGTTFTARLPFRPTHHHTDRRTAEH